MKWNDLLNFSIVGKKYENIYVIMYNIIENNRTSINQVAVALTY